jgi:uncharacterized membrane protein
MSIKVIAFRVLAILALVTCVASLIDHLRPIPLFCGDKFGCEEVNQSVFGSIFGVPLPVFGIVAFALFLGASLCPARPVVRCLGPMAILAGFFGFGFVLIQALLIQRFCPLCLIIDALGM